MRFSAWARLLLRNNLAISPARLPTAAMLTTMAGFNSLLGAIDRSIYGRRVASVVVPDDPVIIVGHWRTGTTMLHELMGLDPRNRCPTTYEALSPCHFLLTETFARKRLMFLAPRRRPMDNVEVGFDRPQEDEAAMCCLGQPSPFLTVAFPNRPLQDPRYRDFQDLTAGERAERWRVLKDFLQRVLYRRPGQLVLKSPQHTFRLRYVLEAFPRARFIHLARDPYVVFTSTVHFWRQMYIAYGLQVPTFEGMDEFVLETFEHMQKRLDEDRPFIDPDRWHELRYEELVMDPVGAVESIYRRLGLGELTPAFRDAVSAYAARSYETNRFATVPDAVRQQINVRWRPYFDRYSYPLKEKEAVPA
jgi:hypothetical protein